LTDPRARTLEAYALDGGDWREIGRFAGGALVSVPPFEAVTVNLEDLWAPSQSSIVAASLMALAISELCVDFPP
jgi:hypothetical protein